MPSSYVSGLRVRSSGVSRPRPMRGSNFRTNRLSTPNSFKESWMFFSTPSRIDATRIATMVPMTTPRTVRNERTLCVRMVSSAILMSSSIMLECVMLGLESQGFYGVQLGCFIGWINPEENAYGRGNQHSDNDPAYGQTHGK